MHDAHVRFAQSYKIITCEIYMTYDIQTSCKIQLMIRLIIYKFSS